MTVDISPSPSRGFQMPRPKTLLFTAIAAMYVFVLLTVESFLFDKSNPEWAHIAPFQWCLLPQGMAAPQILHGAQDLRLSLHPRLLYRCAAGPLYPVDGREARHLFSQLHHRHGF